MSALLSALTCLKRWRQLRLWRHGPKSRPAHAAHLLLLPGCLLAVLLAVALLPTLLLPVPLAVVELPVHLPLLLEVWLCMLLLGLPGRLPLPILALLPIAVSKALGVGLAVHWWEALQHELKTH